MSVSGFAPARPNMDPYMTYLTKVLLILAIYRHIWKVLRFVEDGFYIPFRCRDRLELVLVFEARDFNSVIQQTVRSGIWRNSKLKTKETPFCEECVWQSIERVASAFNSATNWIRFRATKNDFRHQELDSLPLWSMQHAVVTLNNQSGAEIMTENDVIG